MLFSWRNALRSKRNEPTVEFRKIDLYLLDPDEPKSRWFTAKGFRRTRPMTLALALEAHHADGTALRRQTTAYGEKVEIDGPLAGPDGRVQRLRSIWIIETGSTTPRLVTAYLHELLSLVRDDQGAFDAIPATPTPLLYRAKPA